ncbi:MAG: GGDEF domain-containing protein [Acidobacteriota bacterium]
MTENEEIKTEFKAAELLAFDLYVKNNQWLLKVRTIYSILISVYFLGIKFIHPEQNLMTREIILIFALAVIGNLIIGFSLKNVIKKKGHNLDHTNLLSLASLQLDFDLVVFSLLIFISGGIKSPVMILYIFYILISAFIVDSHKYFRNTTITIVLVSILFLAEKTLPLTSKLSQMIAFDIILLSTYFISSYLSKNLRENKDTLQYLLKRTRDLSITDGLTGLFNQTHFFYLLSLQIKKSDRYNHIFSVALFDIDNFKVYNDKNGHINGSKAISRVGKIVKETFRTFDISARYGGDEFVVILPNTDKIGAFLAADRLREIVGKEKFEGMEHQPGKKITLSIGISSYPSDGDTKEDILNSADKALYEAKGLGRDRVVIFEQNPSKSGH